jgi:CheY-like chemotaxis protein
MAKYAVLIADDDESQRNIQKLVFADVAKEVGGELKIDEAVDSVETKRLLGKEKYDLIILDNEFKDDAAPGHLPGIALLQLMRKGGPNIASPTVFCTGDPYDTLRPMAEKHNAVYYPKAKADVEEMTQLYTKLLKK